MTDFHGKIKNLIFFHKLQTVARAIETWRLLLSLLMGCLHDPANVQQTFSKCIQNTRANAGRLPDRVNTL